MTDASCGLGFVLQQQHGDIWHIVQTGSRFLSDTESRYATIEKEMFGVSRAILKCHKFLAGLSHFGIISDYNPLLAILNNCRLDEIENPRLQRLRTKLMPYNFTAHWQKGVLHNALDALSRYLISDPASVDTLAEHQQLHPCQIAALQERQKLNLKLQNALKTAETDRDYQALKLFIAKGFRNSKSELPDNMKPFWRVRHDLTLDSDCIMFGCHLFIPDALRLYVVVFCIICMSPIRASRVQKNALVLLCIGLALIRILKI